MGPGTFTCGACGGTFPRGWTDEEAAAEALAAFSPGELLTEAVGVVCDDCWQAMRREMPDLDARYQ